MQVNIHDAKSQLSRLAERVHNGETIVIAKAGKPYMDLVPHRASPMRQPGRLRGEIELGPDFDETPDEVIRAFDGEY